MRVKIIIPVRNIHQNSINLPISRTMRRGLGLIVKTFFEILWATGGAFYRTIPGRLNFQSLVVKNDQVKKKKKWIKSRFSARARKK